eukprot:scaffold59726_cov30-Tisochrysis_lutea.AAC.3
MLRPALQAPPRGWLHALQGHGEGERRASWLPPRATRPSVYVIVLALRCNKPPGPRGTRNPRPEFPGGERVKRTAWIGPRYRICTQTKDRAYLAYLNPPLRQGWCAQPRFFLYSMVPLRCLRLTQVRTAITSSSSMKVHAPPVPKAAGETGVGHAPFADAETKW